MSERKVLLIEDDPVTRNSLQRVIAKEGYQVISAGDGYEGLNLFRSERPDIVITDVKMPRIDGLEIMYTVKRLSPETEVILITGHGDYDTAIVALRQGALDYLKKPVDLDRLIVSLGRAGAKITETRRSQTKTSVMILEDDDKARDNLFKIFEKEGYETYSGRDGEEGLRIFSEKRIDILLVDIEMPNKGGMEVLHEVRHLTDDCEVIMMTGYGDENTAIEALHDGAINYIRKPIDVEQVLLSVQKAADRLQLHRAFLYKARELELAHEIIAKITEQRELQIELGQNLQINAEDLASQIMNMIPIPFLLLDEHLKVEFINRCVRQRCGAVPEIVDAQVIRALGLGDLTREQLEKDARLVFDEDANKMKIYSISPKIQLVMVKVTILLNKTRRERLLVFVGGGC